MKLKTLNRIVSVLVILINGYFLPVTIISIESKINAFGVEVLSLPVSISINLLLLPSILAFSKKFNSSFSLLIINGLGFLWTLFLFLMLMTTPKLD